MFKKKIKPYNRNKTNKKRIVFISFVFCFFIILIFAYLNYVVNPVIFEMSYAKISSLAQRAVSSAIYDVINTSRLYESLVTIVRNNDGDIAMISSNALQINLLTRELTRSAHKNLEVIGVNGIEIPVGSFSGLPILVGRGPEINIKMLPIGTISSNYISKFEQAGINQTNHKIYVQVESKVSVILPTASKIVTTSTELMIAESIIIGKIPLTYLNSTNLQDMMDLVPS
ncbi:MAG: sporulation protein YunB [Clostridia bacterium]